MVYSTIHCYPSRPLRGIEARQFEQRPSILHTLTAHYFDLYVKHTNYFNIN